MKLFNFFNKTAKTATEQSLNLYQLTFSEETVFGVTADNSEEALQLVCEEIFHNQTIPGIPKIEELTKKDALSKAAELKVKITKAKGVWRPK